MGPYKVYVGNLPGDFDSEDLRDFFEHAGPIVDAYVVYYPDGQSRQFGFIRFGNARAQRNALATMHGHWVSGHVLFVEEARGQDNAGANWYTLEFDGASRGNPGPAAAGAVLYDSNMFTVGEVSKYLGPSFTNNQAEYNALILGLELALEYCVERLEIRGDSELVIRQLQGQYQVRSRRLAPLYRKVQELFGAFEEQPLLYHIPRGANEEADRLANEALDNEVRSFYAASESDSEDDDW